MITGYDYAIIAFYLAFMLSLGWLFRSLSKNTSDYFRCGGSMPWWITGTSAWIASFSAWTFVGAASEVYRGGYTVLPVFFAMVPALLVVFIYTCVRFRRLRVVTWMEAVRERFGPFTEQFYTWLKVPIQLLLSAMGLMAISIFMAAVFKMEVWKVQVILGVVITIVACTGGAFAVLASDFVQMFLVMTITLVTIFLTFRLPEVGGVTGLYTQVLAKHPDHIYWWSQFRFPILLAYLLAFVWVKTNEQNNLENATMYLMPRSDKHARRMVLIPLVGSIVGPLIWTIPPLAATLLFTNADLATFTAGPDYANVSLAPLSAPLTPQEQSSQQQIDKAFTALREGKFSSARGTLGVLTDPLHPHSVSTDQRTNIDRLMSRLAALPTEPTEAAFVAVATRVMPVGLLGLLLCAMFGATLTSMDAGVNKCVGVFIRSFYRPMLNPKASEKHLLVAGKVCTLLFGAIIIGLSIAVAHARNKDLFNFMNQLGVSLGIPLGLPLLFGLFYKRTPAWSAPVTAAICLVVVGWANILFKSQIAQPDFISTLPPLLQNLLGHPQTPLTQGEQNYLLLAVTALLTSAVGALVFFGSSLFYRSSSPAHLARVEALFTRLRTPVEAAPDATITDEPLYRLLGTLCTVYGLFVLLLMIIPNPLLGRLCFLFVGGIILTGGIILSLIAQRKRRAAASLVARPEGTAALPVELPT